MLIQDKNLFAKNRNLISTLNRNISLYTPANSRRSLLITILKDETMASNFYLDTFGIFTTDVIGFENEIGVDGKFGVPIVDIHQDWGFILKAMSGINTHEIIYLTNGKALLRAVTGVDFLVANQALSDTQKLSELVESIELAFVKTIAKASRHFKDGGIREFSDLERKILSLNKSLWEVRNKFEGRIFIFPDSPACRELHPSDPSKLKIDKARKETELDLTDVILLGAYSCSEVTPDFYENNINPLVDVVLRVAHEIPELKTRMPLLEAQQIWKGIVRISCKVRIINNKLAEIIGDIQISKYDTTSLKWNRLV